MNNIGLVREIKDNRDECEVYTFNCTRNHIVIIMYVVFTDSNKYCCGEIG